MNYTFERDLSRLAEAGTPPLMALAEIGNTTPEETFERLSREFAEAYDKGELSVDEKGIGFKSALATINLIENQNPDSSYPYYLRFTVLPVTETELLTRDRAREIHQLLLEHFEAGEWYPMVVVSQVLNKAGFRKERFGFSKMKGMFLALATFLTMRDTVTNGTPDVEIRICALDESASVVQSVTPYAFSNDLSQLIQGNSPAVAAYARNCNKTVEDAFEGLCDIFADAFSQGAIREDASGLHFADGNVAVSLVPNTVKESPYPYYLSFREEIQSAFACEVLELDDEQEIYRLLTGKFPIGEWLPMASVSLVLVQEGFSKERFGFTKMRDMLETLRRFISLQPTVTNGVPAILVKLHRVSEWEQGAAVSPARESKSVTLPAMLREVKLTGKTLSKINFYMTGTEAFPPESVIDSLCAAYAEAEKPQRPFKVGETFRFSTDLKTAGGQAIDATIKVSEKAEVDWYLNWGGPAEAAVSCSPGEMLERFAYLGPWQEFLSTLANKSLPEKWSFKDAAEGDYTILRQYIRFTFYHLHLEDKVLVSNDNTLAAFNTGLVTRHYEDIYACFMPNLKQGGPKWFFQGFCIAGERGLGKQLVDAFDPLPEAASYFTVKEDLLFDTDREIYADYNHIIVDNIHRLPLDFLRDELRVDEEACALVEELMHAAPYQKSELYDRLRDAIGASSRLYNRLKNRVSDAIDFAVKRVRWNFKTALPCFYPRGNAMSLMLPLALVEDNRVDVALIVERTKAGSYQGQTILTLQDAYIDARLICRPDSEWLSTSDITAFVEEED